MAATRLWRSVSIITAGCSSLEVQLGVVCCLLSLNRQMLWGLLMLEYGEGVVSAYMCCGERRDSGGCQVADVSTPHTHVHTHTLA